MVWYRCCDGCNLFLQTRQVGGEGADSRPKKGGKGRGRGRGRFGSDSGKVEKILCVCVLQESNQRLLLCRLKYDKKPAPSRA